MKNRLPLTLAACLLALGTTMAVADDTRLPAYPAHGPGMMMGPGYGWQMTPEQRQQHWQQMQQHHYQMHGPYGRPGYGMQLSPEERQRRHEQMQQFHQQQGMPHGPGMMGPGWHW